MLFGIFEINNILFHIILDAIKPCFSGELEELLSEKLFSFCWIILDARLSNEITSTIELFEGLISIFSRLEFFFKFSGKIIEFWLEWDIDSLSLSSLKSESSNLSLFLTFH